MPVLRTTADELVFKLRAAADAARDLKRPLASFGLHMKDVSIPDNFKAKGRPDAWAKSPTGQDDSGRLKRSIQFRLSATSVRIGTNTAYAKQRHFGGTIKAKDKALAMPLNVSRTRRRPQHYKDLVFVLVGKGNLKGLLISPDRRKVKKGAAPRPGIVRFLLLRQVSQPARPFLLFQAADVALGKRLVLAHVLGGKA